jgi:hypothetical protein
MFRARRTARFHSEADHDRRRRPTCARPSGLRRAAGKARRGSFAGEANHLRQIVTAEILVQLDALDKNQPPCFSMLAAASFR